MKANLNQCECGKTYNINETGATDTICLRCNEKLKYKLRRKDNLRKNLNRDDKVSSNLEKLSEIVE